MLTFIIIIIISSVENSCTAFLCILFILFVETMKRTEFIWNTNLL